MSLKVPALQVETNALEALAESKTWNSLKLIRILPVSESTRVPVRSCGSDMRMVPAPPAVAPSYRVCCRYKQLDESSLHFLLAGLKLHVLNQCYLSLSLLLPSSRLTYGRQVISV